MSDATSSGTRSSDILQLDLPVEFDEADTGPAKTTSLISAATPGKDEMNLAEFPFAVLAKRVSAGQKTIEVIQEGRDALGRPVRQEWLVTGSDHFGLPVATDDDTYVALMKLLRDNQFRDRTVRFTVSQLLRIMHSHTGKRDYDRIAASLDRLTGVLLRSKNAFWDHSRRGYVTEAFHLLDGYRLATGGSGRELSEVTFSQFLFGSIQAGYVKNLDVDFYFSLSTPLARRLYRLLDKHRYRAQTYNISLERLARKLPLQDKYESQIKRRLDPVFAEFVERGFLTGTEYRAGSRGGTVVSIRFGERAAAISGAEPAQLPPPITSPCLAPGGPENGTQTPLMAGPAAAQATISPVAALTDRLIAAGVSRAVAEELVQNHNMAEVERQLDYLPYVEDLKNPGGYLRQAIEQGYAPPPKYPKRPKQPARRARAKSAPERICRPTSLGARGQTESSSGDPADRPADISGPADLTDRIDLSGVPEELRAAWQRVLAVLAVQANRPAFEAHIRPLLPLRLEEGKVGEKKIVYVRVPSAFTRDWVLKHYRNQIAQVLGEMLDPEAARGIEVRFALLSAADAVTNADSG